VTSTPPLSRSAAAGTRGADAPTHSTTAELSLRPDTPVWKAWPAWVGYTTTGHVVSGLVIGVLPRSLPGGFAVAFTVVAAGLGIAALLQWLILRRWAQGLRWWSWVVATVVGQLAATTVVGMAVLGSLATSTLERVGAHAGGHVLQLAMKVTSGALSGGVEGFAQWLILRRHLPAAGWWILGVISAEVLAAAASLIVDQGTAFEGLGLLMMKRLTSGFIVGATTGAVLVWLLRERRELPTSG
jgi:hypothetical protein